LEAVRLPIGPTPQARRADTRLAFRDPAGAPLGERSLNSRHLLYVPLAVYLALCAALTDRAACRRALLFGLPAVLAFSSLRLVVTLAEASAEAGLIFTSAPYWRSSLMRLETLAVTLPTIWFLLPALVWLSSAGGPAILNRSGGA